MDPSKVIDLEDSPERDTFDDALIDQAINDGIQEVLRPAIPNLIKVIHQCSKNCDYPTLEMVYPRVEKYMDQKGHMQLLRQLLSNKLPPSETILASLLQNASPGLSFLEAFDSHPSQAVAELLRKLRDEEQDKASLGSVPPDEEEEEGMKNISSLNYFKEGAEVKENKMDYTSSHGEKLQDTVAQPNVPVKVNKCVKSAQIRPEPNIDDILMGKRDKRRIPRARPGRGPKHKYFISYMDKSTGHSTIVSTRRFRQFMISYPEVANYLYNPETIPYPLPAQAFQTVFHKTSSPASRHQETKDEETKVYPPFPSHALLLHSRLVKHPMAQPYLFPPKFAFNPLTFSSPPVLSTAAQQPSQANLQPASNQPPLNSYATYTPPLDSLNKPKNTEEDERYQNALQNPIFTKGVWGSNLTTLETRNNPGQSSSSQAGSRPILDFPSSASLSSLMFIYTKLLHNCYLTWEEYLDDVEQGLMAWVEYTGIWNEVGYKAAILLKWWKMKINKAIDNWRVQQEKYLSKFPQSQNVPQTRQGQMYTFGRYGVYQETQPPPQQSQYSTFPYSRYAGIEARKKMEHEARLKRLDSFYDAYDSRPQQQQTAVPITTGRQRLFETKTVFDTMKPQPNMQYKEDSSTSNLNGSEIAKPVMKIAESNEEVYSDEFMEALEEG
jgi:hypothetical protein